MFDTIDYAHLKELHFVNNEATQLHAIVAIHNTDLGPALGGCRCIEYDNDQSAILDAIRLAKAMSYKAALADLALGGGKAVLLKPKVIDDRKAYFESFGEFVQDLGGRYITTLDCGTNIDDMNNIGHSTSFVRGTTSDGCDPSINTALGVIKGIEACVEHKLNTRSLEGIHVAIQGVGNVGLTLAKYLYENGARLTVSDINKQKLAICQQEFAAECVDVEDIYEVECDIFSPCGLGAILNPHTIAKLNCQIIAGSANNQLAEDSDGELIHQRNILYAPDYVINAGGLIQVSMGQDSEEKLIVRQKTLQIKQTLREIFTQADSQSLRTALIADQLAENILYH